MDSIRRGNQEVVHEGWLLKSPPTKLWKARWRERWFILRHSGELPGQYFLEYYVDKQCKKLKGRIDLDQCEQVDAGLSFENKKEEKYQFMFSVRTPKRTYFLVAKNDPDMNKWVNAICQVCGLKAQEEDQQCQMFPYEPQESPPVSPSEFISGPYIPISECISGNRYVDTSLNNCDNKNADSSKYDLKLQVPSLSSTFPISQDNNNAQKDGRVSPPKVNWETFPSIGDLKSCVKINNAEISRPNGVRSFGKKIDSPKSACINKVLVPPRPPKPSYIIPDNPGHNYLNLDGATESSKPTTPITPNPTESNTFFRSSEPTLESKCTDDNLSLNAHFQMKSNDNIASTSSILESPPLVHRDLKPKKKNNDSVSNFNYSNSNDPPSINRKLKPTLTKQAHLNDDEFSSGLSSGIHKANIISSHTYQMHHLSISDEENIEDKRNDICSQEEDENLTPRSSRHLALLQYLDLDLNVTGDNATNLPVTHSPPSTTVYKTIDFFKTNAFNRTRQRVEEERKQCSVDLT